MGLAAIGAFLYLRRKTLGGAELALYWFAAATLYAIAAVSIVTWLDLFGTTYAGLLTRHFPFWWQPRSLPSGVRLLAGSSSLSTGLASP